jgi:hypothetical protein
MACGATAAVPAAVFLVGRVVAAAGPGAAPARQRHTPANTAATARFVLIRRTVTREIPRP